MAVSYGSAAGELAACVSAAGIADSSGLTKLELSAPPGQLRELVERMTGGAIAPGGLLHAGGAWWCAVPGAGERVIVLGPPRLGERVRTQLAARSARHPALLLRDRTDDWAAITILGAATTAVLASLRVYGEAGDPRLVAPFTIRPLAGIEAMWLLESRHRALALVPRPHAGAAWQAIERAGRPQGICCVGQDAVARYALLERRSQRPARD